MERFLYPLFVRLVRVLTLPFFAAGLFRVSVPSDERLPINRWVNTTDFFLPPSRKESEFRH